jgi:hypothetical protein
MNTKQILNSQLEALLLDTKHNATFFQQDTPEELIRDMLAKVWGFDEWDTLNSCITNKEDPRIRLVESIVSKKERISIEEYNWIFEAGDRFGEALDYEGLDTRGFRSFVHSVFCIDENIFSLLDPWLLTMDGKRSKPLSNDNKVDLRFSQITNLLKAIPRKWVIDKVSRKVLEELINKGHDESLHFLGKLLLQINDREGFDLLIKSANQGHAESAYIVWENYHCIDEQDPEHYFTDLEIENKEDLDKEFLSLAANLGQPDACWNYFNGVCNGDTTKGMKYLLKGFEGQHSDASTILARYFEKRDPERSIKIYIEIAKNMKTCESGEIEAYDSLTYPGAQHYVTEIFRRDFGSLDDTSKIPLLLLLDESGLVPKTLSEVSKEGLPYFYQEYIASNDDFLSAGKLLQSYVELSKDEKRTISKVMTAFILVKDADSNQDVRQR